MEIVLLSKSSVFPRAMSGFGKKVKKTSRRCHDWSVQTMQRKLHGQSWTSICWRGSVRNNGLAILPSLVRLKALELVKDEKYNIPEEQFKVGNHCCQHLMKRNALSLWQKTTLARRLPADYKEKVVWFHRFIIEHCKEHCYPLHLVANMDETPLTFDMPPNCTINNTSEKTIKICTTGIGKNRVTVMLACCGDG